MPDPGSRIPTGIQQESCSMPISMQSSVCTPWDPECAEQGGHQGSSGCPGHQQSPGDVPRATQKCPQGSREMSPGHASPQVGTERGTAAPRCHQLSHGQELFPAFPSLLWLSQPWGQSQQPLCLQKRFQATPLPIPGVSQGWAVGRTSRIWAQPCPSPSNARELGGF